MLCRLKVHNFKGCVSLLTRKDLFMAVLETVAVVGLTEVIDRGYQKTL